MKYLNLYLEDCCVFVRAPSSIFLHVTECLSAFFWSLSQHRQTQPDKRQTDTVKHLRAPADRHDLSWHNDLLIHNLPLQSMSASSIRLIKPERDVLVGWICVSLTLGLLSFYNICVLLLSFSVCLSLSTTLNQEDLLIKRHIFLAVNRL